MLDASAAAYSSRGSQGMTLWADSRPVPFTLTINSPQQAASIAGVANFKSGYGTADFDLNMPQRSYNSVTLKFAGRVLVARARVTTVPGEAELGRFVLFDLIAQGGEANTTMRFGERQDAVLHVSMEILEGGELTRTQLVSATVPPIRSEQTLFTDVAASPVQAIGTNSVAQFDVARGVPVERVQVRTAGTAPFRRMVRVRAGADEAQGAIERENAVRDGVSLRVEDENIDAVLPENQQSAMRVTVSVENGALPALPVESVELQMRQRQVCFNAWPGVEHWRLFYGSPTLQFVTLGGRSRSLVQKMDPLIAPLGPETLAANFRPLADPPDRAPLRLLVVTLVYLALFGTWVARVLRRARIPHVRR